MFLQNVKDFFCRLLASSTVGILADVIWSLSVVFKFSLIYREVFFLLYFELLPWCGSHYLLCLASHTHVHCEGPVTSVLESDFLFFFF